MVCSLGCDKKVSEYQRMFTFQKHYKKGLYARSSIIVRLYVETITRAALCRYHSKDIASSQYENILQRQTNNLFSNIHKINTLPILLKILIGCSCQKMKGKGSI